MSWPLESFDYRGAIQVSDRLIRRFGAWGSIRHNGKDYPALIVSVNNSARARNGDLESMDLQRCYLSVTGLPFVPGTYDIVTMPDGSKRRVRESNPMQPAITAVYVQLSLEGP